jgi:hypothetical protein
MIYFEILFDGLISVGFVLAATKEAAVAKYKEREQFLENTRLVAIQI